MHYKKIEKQIITEEKEVIIDNFYICDKCDKKIIKGYYNAFEFTLIQRTGNSYPESGLGEEQEIHLCEECSNNLFTLLQNNGYRVNKTEWDW